MRNLEQHNALSRLVRKKFHDLDLRDAFVYRKPKI